MSERLTHAECLAWAERYAATPWNLLALSTASDKQPSALLVLKSALLNADALAADLAAAQQALRDRDDLIARQRAFQRGEADMGVAEWEWPDRSAFASVVEGTPDA